MNMLDKVYVVIGMTGEYSDHQEWYVAAYTTREMAQTHMEIAENWLNLHGYGLPPSNSKKEHDNPYDPYFQFDQLSGTSYEVAEVSLYDHLDQFLGLK